MEPNTDRPEQRYSRFGDLKSTLGFASPRADTRRPSRGIIGLMTASVVNPRFGGISVSVHTHSALLTLTDDYSGVIHLRFRDSAAVAGFVMGLIDGVESHVKELQDEAGAGKTKSAE